MTVILEPLPLLYIALAAFYSVYVTIHTDGLGGIFANLRTALGVQEQQWDSEKGEWIPCTAPGMAKIFCCAYCATPWWILFWLVIWQAAPIAVQVIAGAGLACVVYVVVNRE